MYRGLAKMLCLSLIVCMSATLMNELASAQTIISGDIAGTITDPTGAAVAGATVTLTSAESGTVETSTPSATGAFRFSLLRPGVYKLQVNAPGFAAVSQTVNALVDKSSRQT